MSKIVFDTMRVLQFIKQRVPVLASENMKGLGLEKDSELIAGVLYEGYTGVAVWAHVAAIPGARWLNRDFLRYSLEYAYTEMGCKHIFGWVEAGNIQARRFDEHLGFRPVAQIEGAGKDGGAVVIYRMDRDDCRFLKQGVRHGQE
jgi:RimJ/RimL family protein N-acetyltransferase